MWSPFVEPRIVRLPVGHGQTVDIKERLNAGETRRVFGRMVSKMEAGQPIELNPEKVGLTKLMEYIVGWSLVDSAGQPVPISEAAVNNLDPDFSNDILKAIDAHEAAVDAAREEEKKDQATANAS